MSAYPAVSIQHAGTELDRLHKAITEKLQSTVQDAIRAGEILSQVKGRIPHGDFIPWLKANCSFSERTAQNYMRLFRYRDKTATVADLQTAYRQLEVLEAHEKRSEDQKARDRVRVFLTTGEKPEGWRRGTDDKLVEEEKERDAKFAELKEKMAAAEKARQEQDEQRRARMKENRAETDAASRILDEAAKAAMDAHEKRRTLKQRMRMSDAASNDHFVDALLDYLDELENDNRRIEACNNIIKACRNIAAELQGGV